MVINKAGLYSYVDGTISEPDRQLEAMAKLILTIGLPDSIFGSMLYLETAHNYYKYLTNRFNKSIVQPLQEQLQKIEGCRDTEPQVAARTRKTFGRPCRKCGERGHKACECRTVSIESESSRVEEKGKKGQRAAKRVSKDEAAARRPGTVTTAKTTAGMSLATPVSSPEPDMASWQVDNPTADAVNPNATCAGPTRPADELSNPPEALPSTSLEGGSRTGTSDELGRVPNDETTITQSTWMPRDESPSREVHGVARSHEEAAGVDVEGGEASERTRTGDDEERQVRERIDDRETGMAG